jgi:glucosamine--fructose-6-phosphate aminotransferase (isomerizing)
MCGIVGYIGPRDAVPILLDGLRRLEYRGYDSAGVVTLSGRGLHCAKAPGKLSVLAGLLRKRPLPGRVGLGHTRWATHGAPTEANAHPHFSCDRAVALVHNGIIENADRLRARLRRAGHVFRSQTDTEVLVHLVEEERTADPLEAVRRAVARVEGSYAVGVIFRDHPDCLVAARHGSPLVLGLAPGASLMASDIPPLIPHTRRVIPLRDRDVALLRADGVEVRDGAGRRIGRTVVTVGWDAAAAEKGGHAHFMIKEIHEQPRALAQLLADRFEAGRGEVRWGELEPLRRVLPRIGRVIVVACGTAAHAGIVGKVALEDLARIPAEVHLASEFRYGRPVLDRRTLVVAVSQSGETADTLAAVGLAREAGAAVLAVTNGVGSSITRMTRHVLSLRAGPEIGVAATKTYTAQAAAVLWFALGFGRLRGTVAPGRARRLARALLALPRAAEEALAADGAVRACAARFRGAKSFMYIGRRYNLATAYEGALKLKEISYVHAEGYGGGEMKHGPLALVAPGYPTVAVAVRGPVYDKMLSNIEEVRARRGEVIAVGAAGDRRLCALADAYLPIPDVDEEVSPVVAILPLQLLAYRIAVRLGRDVDQPRNLAKSVTVE